MAIFDRIRRRRLLRKQQEREQISRQAVDDFLSRNPALEDAYYRYRTSGPSKYTDMDEDVASALQTPPPGYTEGQLKSLGVNSMNDVQQLDAEREQEIQDNIYNPEDDLGNTTTDITIGADRQGNAYSNLSDALTNATDRINESREEIRHLNNTFQGRRARRLQRRLNRFIGRTNDVLGDLNMI